MTQPVLDVDNLGKSFRTYGSEWSRVLSWFGLPSAALTERWVLRHVGFRIQPGEAVGIVGQNGAGKSTLLKLITGTLRPTTGSVRVRGRIAAILELGMGMNPEFTGRQNVHHVAGLMGFSHSQIDALMPEIEDFAEIGTYFDQPLRVYSSGMQMRVAFSVATAVKPEILIVDEALSVGDAYFQHKSFDRIRAYREAGTTLLIVSHDRSAIQTLCDRAILLERGAQVKDGPPEEVMDYYNALLAEREGQTLEVRRQDNGLVQTISGSFEATVEDVALLNHRGDPVEFVNVGEEVTLRLKVRAHQAIPRLVMGYMIKDRLGQTMFGTNTFHTEQILEDVAEGSSITYSAAFTANLGPGSYSVATALVSSDTHLLNNYEWRDLALLFTVSNQDKPYFIGTAWVPPTIRIER
ncbi:sugar ABC transporter ATP-binding protein [Skermanella stibiiresistens SB22]|uniref:Sugar ABC transporter ATP-binding protein n=1 Tax=Skermanella stibiiresistens SB22 TaxID=1385369 RepID=W9GQ82_9PROT|nr:ABC transporter ATP-binding protein [Skermanella stibiiresistens]EWY36065.1 sugar ABC transporter ATP-binding protein [Skermanella stibiiresistens SB22]